MALLDLLLRSVSRIRHRFGGRPSEKPIESGPGYPVW
ncbi:MAG: hypothetical protein QOE06_2850 [Thermoleophilaceae bacterium]|jgi:hypothetical protein|nr:hypothetical protein [Thermoleophilaceae bacterium]